MRGFNLLVVPGSPALVAELSPRDAAGRAIVAKARELTAGDTRAIEIVGSRDPRWRTEHTGSFRAWGADVHVGGGNYLPELIARYIFPGRTIVNSREHIQPLNPDALTVVVVDGSAGLTPRAPLALISGAAETHRAMSAFLDGTGELPAELPGVMEPGLWEELGVLEASKSVLVSDDSLGVGRFLAAWEVHA
nr:Uncharacterised protein [Streptococcus thermophilus]